MTTANPRGATYRSIDVLVVYALEHYGPDITGTNVKVLASGMKEPIKIPSGPQMAPAVMVKQVKEVMKDVDYDVVSIGYPAPVGRRSR